MAYDSGMASELLVSDLNPAVIKCPRHAALNPLVVWTALPTVVAFDGGHVCIVCGEGVDDDLDELIADEEEAAPAP